MTGAAMGVRPLHLLTSPGAMIPVCLDHAAADPNVRGCLAVYIKLFSQLDYLAYRPAKLLPLAHVLGVSDARVSQALTVLVSRGYLARGPDAGQGHTYRLTVSPLG